MNHSSKKSSILFVPGVLFLLFCYTGCSVRSVYVPTSHSVLLFDERKQVQTNAYIGTNHVELQLSHNPVNHFAAGMNLNYGTGLSIYEGFLGVYNYSKNNAKWRYELLGGGGYTNNFSQQYHAWGNLFKESKSDYETLALYSKFFVQPSFGYFGKMEIYKLSYSFSVSCRAAYLHFDKYIFREIDQDQTLLQGSPVYIVSKEYRNSDLYLLEPCITNKVGLKNVFGIIQGQFMIPYSSEIDIRNTKFSPVFVLSIGLQYTFILKGHKQPQQ